MRIEAAGVFDSLVTDAPPPADVTAFLGESGVTIVVADQHLR